MAGKPKEARVRAELRRRAAAELGDAATEVDYLVHFRQAGGFFSALAKDLTAALGEPVSRPFLSAIANASDEAKSRLAAARTDAAAVYVEEARDIARNAPETTAGVQKARLEVGFLQWLAERTDPNAFGGPRPEININFGQLHLNALRNRQTTATATVLPESQSSDEQLALPDYEVT